MQEVIEYGKRIKELIAGRQSNARVSADSEKKNSKFSTRKFQFLLREKKAKFITLEQKK